MKQGEKQREAAAPARQNLSESEKQHRGENLQEPALPASQSMEERRRQAGLRREREEAQRRQAEEKRVSQAYAAGLAAKAPAAEAPAAEAAETLTDPPAQGLPEDQTAAMVAGLLAQRRQELLLREGERQLRQELEEIGAIDPTLGSTEEIMAGREGAALLALMDQTPGLRLSQAYILVHFDRLAEAAAKRAARMAAGQMAGTRHLRPMPGRGNGQAGPPQATLEMYRTLFPGKSDRDFARHWNKKNEA